MKREKGRKKDGQRDRKLEREGERKKGRQKENMCVYRKRERKKSLREEHNNMGIL